MGTLIAICAPAISGGGGGSGAARATNAKVASSSRVDPELRAMRA